MRSFRGLVALMVTGCAAAPVVARETDTKAKAATSSAKPEASGTAAAPAEPASAEEASPIYSEPPPQIIRRHHVFGVMRARAANKVTITSVLTTASDEAETLALGTEALLEFKAKGDTEWVPIADVIVKKVSTKGSRVAGNERQDIELEISQARPVASGKGKQNPFVAQTRVRLQVDRPSPNE